MHRHQLAIVCLAVLLVAPACKEKSTSDKSKAKRAAGQAGDAAPTLVAVSDYTYFRTDQCIACHRDIVTEWRTSMHANATRAKDPIYALLFTKARKVMGPKVEKGCAKCHNPLAGLAGPTRPLEGVSCVACHEIAPNHPAKLASGEMMKLARQVPGTTGPQSLCLSCHGERKNGQGQHVCTTGAESDHAGGLCVDCHMKKAPGSPTLGLDKPDHRTHRFPGGHSPQMVKGTLSLALSHDAKTKEIVVRITAGDVGHSLPTGNPMRHIVIHVQAYGKNKVIVWDNLMGKASLFDTKGALLMRLFSGADGKKPVPPFLAKGPAIDTRLASKETRTLRYPMPKRAVRITARAEYYLAPKKIRDAAKLPKELAGAIVIHSTSLSVGATP